MNTESVDCRNVGAYSGIERAGDFYFADREGTPGIMIQLPDNSWCHLQIQQGPSPAEGKMWGWDGNTEKPTLIPSIHCIGHWHGYMREGRLVSC